MYVLFDRRQKIDLINNAHAPTIPFWCPICSYVISDSLDAESYNDIGACRDCEKDFVDPNREKWLDGWRPSEKDLKKIIENRSRRFFQR